MPVQLNKHNLLGIAGTLVKKGLLSEIDAKMVLDRTQNASFVTSVVKEKLVSSYAIAHAVAEEFCYPILDLNALKLDQTLIELVGENFLRKQLENYHKKNKSLALPIFKRGNSLFLAVSDPENQEVLAEIRFSAKMPVSVIIVETEILAKTIRHAIAPLNDNQDEISEQESGDFDFGEDEGDETIIVKFIHSMLLKAIKISASELQFEPYEKNFRVRFRVDGILKVIAQIPPKLARKLAADVKVMLYLDDSKYHVPQEGRIKVTIPEGNAIDLIINIAPTLWGEKIVMRIIDSSAANFNIDILGYEEEQKRLYLKGLANPEGMIIVTGPRESGKTLSLYTGINILNTESVNISTITDSVEIDLSGTNQFKIDEKNGMTFSKVLKAVLRQRPDILVMDEIRAFETGKMAINAALTGHKVMYTLYANDTFQALTNMIAMGIKPFAIASAVNLIMAQRLCRRLCSCKVQQYLPDKILQDAGFKDDEIPWLRLFEAKKEGCVKCNGSGYKGRVGIFQVMPISDEMKCLIIAEKTAIDFAIQAQKEGILDLRQSGLKKVKDGLTSLEELDRVTLF